MSFRTDSLYQRLTEPQRDELMIAMMEAKRGDRASIGHELCKKWSVKASRTSVHDFYKRYSFGWRLERGAWVAKATETLPAYEEQKRHLVSQKLFTLATDADCDPKLLVLIRALELDADKVRNKEEDLKLRRDRFEFDAAKAALKHLDALRAIKSNKSLDQGERLKQARLQLFGVTPE